MFAFAAVILQRKGLNEKRICLPVPIFPFAFSFNSIVFVLKCYLVSGMFSLFESKTKFK